MRLLFALQILCQIVAWSGVVFWTQDFAWGSSFTVKASAFQPSIRTRWCTVEVSLLLFHRDDFFLAPFPTARTSATTRASSFCLSLPPSSQSLPGASISLAKDSSFCWAWSWNPWQKAVHIVHTKVFQIPDFPGWILLFIYLLTFISVSGCYTRRLRGSPECPQFWYLWPAGH